ncbi:hypothetical protein SAY87_004154 [Trapa incisa]|uniref:ALOG domain-containing protein n=1 Tax=Trapa incisa TaxID=236973 RepID=A0AAN7JNF2_9MYRT|nr:hypothetical protein SAY87_004154 [Trapa incisa]
MSSTDKGNDAQGGSSSSSRASPAVAAAAAVASASTSNRAPAPQQQLSRYDSQKRRDWNTFCQYLGNQRPPVALHQCNSSHVLEFLRYMDQFGKTKVHVQGCAFYGQPEPPGSCTCPLKQAWGSLDALIGRLRAAYEENGGTQETNPFAGGAIRAYLREVRESQAKARGVPYRKKKRRRKNDDGDDHDPAKGGRGGGDGSTSTSSIPIH